MDNTFVFKKSLKITFIALIVLGLISLGYGILSQDVDSHRLWSNILLNNFYFLAIALGALVFVVVHILSDSGWHVSIVRIPEAMGQYIPVASVLMILILIGAHEIYHWTHTEHLDEILLHKKPYLNMPFFSIRMVVYLAGWIFFAWKIRQLSLKQDAEGDLKYFKVSKTYAALFIAFFAITSSTSAWDWLMSIDAHWFSTLYGWYIFSSIFVSAIAVIILIVVALRTTGYLPHLNEEHLHDLGKYLFGFSIFWAYLWFSQFMLIWYSNIPEETIYYVQRLEHFSTLFYLNLILNFIVPFLVLMTRGSKRKLTILTVSAIVVFIGHWVDLYLAIMPGAVGHEKAGIGILEIGLTMGYIGLFLFIVLRALTKASLVPEKHPFYKESLEYDNI
jgi:hypothetical protein